MASACPLGYGKSQDEAAPASAGAPPAAAAAAAAAAAPAAAAPAASKANACPLGYGDSASSNAGAPATTAPAAAAAGSSSKAPEGVDALSRERTSSTIPSSDGGAFMYPSEKQFFGAASAKGHQLDPNDMSTVVAIHNAVNEQTWQEILRYERFHAKDCAAPKLERFIGRPGELSPKARLLTLLGRSEPFDRHDWHVDRCGTPVRYLVDFYDGQPSPQHPIAIHIDARPELSGGGLVDRLRMWTRTLNIF
eukprot:TRINITY_DN9241_c2_g1_i1.p1 TRINITY_DN9241_c2_g1~~TRINITY_DN9241_c2_g1_i1.p1  ORF type:complete len:250 (+),score=71.55 TRINITY_DN9241_c2_g1_i1:63-812(+)